uniref:Uncharacterized protein n=1 Tax=viral metagenome TaxID=1070528 RepID=A0A6H2A4Z1_9ZZZZ
MATNPYKITLNYQGGIHIYHRHAQGEDHALRLACLALADEAKINLMPILNYYLSNRKDNYRIEKLKNKNKENKNASIMHKVQIKSRSQAFRT